MSATLHDRQDGWPSAARRISALIPPGWFGIPALVVAACSRDDPHPAADAPLGGSPTGQ